MFMGLVPQKSPFYVLLFGGLSFAAYAIQLAYRNLRLILQEYWHAALGEVALVNSMMRHIFHALREQIISNCLSISFFVCLSSLRGTGWVCQFCFVLPVWSSYKWEEHQHPVLASSAGRPASGLLRDSNKASCLCHHRGSSVYQKPGVPCLSCNGYMEVSVDRRWCKSNVININSPLKLLWYIIINNN